jgi:uracil-DNA glycosylase
MSFFVEHPDIYKKLFKGVSADWLPILDTLELNGILQQVYESAAGNMENITPPLENVFAAFRQPMSNINMVIIGQDPYPTPGDAHGHAFSSLSTKIPHSLRNIYKMLVQAGEINSMPFNAHLSAWIDRGILLLNVALTTLNGASLSHIDYWKPYTTQVLNKFTQLKLDAKERLIVLLWGNFAKDLRDYIARPGSAVEGGTGSIVTGHFHQIMEWCHPAARDDQFLICPHFSIINSERMSGGAIPIDWHPQAPIDRADIVVCTDGSAYHDVGGYGIVIYNMRKSPPDMAHCVEKVTNVWGRVPERNVEGKFIFGTECITATSPRTECMAIMYALWALCDTPGNIVIVSDSLMCCQTFTLWIKTWIAQQIVDTKKNADCIREIWKLLSARADAGFTTVFRHMESHVPKYKTPQLIWPRLLYDGNAQADKLAETGRGQETYAIFSRNKVIE